MASAPLPAQRGAHGSRLNGSPDCAERRCCGPKQTLGCSQLGYLQASRREFPAFGRARGTLVSGIHYGREFWLQELAVWRPCRVVALANQHEGWGLSSGTPAVPSPLLTAREAVEIQLEALRKVDHPDGDLNLQRGLEVLYNFAAIDPFNKGSSYFGCTLNVAYFSQFSAKFSMRRYRLLLGLDSYDVLSCLHLSETTYCERVLVRSGKESGIFHFNLTKRLGGHLHMCWLTDSLVRDEKMGEEIIQL